MPTTESKRELTKSLIYGFLEINLKGCKTLKIRNIFFNKKL